MPDELPPRWAVEASDPRQQQHGETPTPPIHTDAAIRCTVTTVVVRPVPTRWLVSASNVSAMNVTNPGGRVDRRSCALPWGCGHDAAARGQQEDDRRGDGESTQDIHGPDADVRNSVQDARSPTPFWPRSTTASVVDAGQAPDRHRRRQPKAHPVEVAEHHDRILTVATPRPRNEGRQHPDPNNQRSDETRGGDQADGAETYLGCRRRRCVRRSRPRDGPLQSEHDRAGNRVQVVGGDGSPIEAISTRLQSRQCRRDVLVLRIEDDATHTVDDQPVALLEADAGRLGEDRLTEVQLEARRRGMQRGAIGWIRAVQHRVGMHGGRVRRQRHTQDEGGDKNTPTTPAPTRIPRPSAYGPVGRAPTTVSARGGLRGSR